MGMEEGGGRYEEWDLRKAGGGMKNGDKGRWGRMRNGDWAVEGRNEEWGLRKIEGGMNNRG